MIVGEEMRGALIYRMLWYLNHGSRIMNLASPILFRIVLLYGGIVSSSSNYVV